MSLLSLPSWNWGSRLRAAAAHLGLSAVVAALAALVVFLCWYPMPYREVAGGRELFLLILSVDLVLGPLVTLAIFDRAKGWPHLRRDLAVVAALQLAALAYGLHTVYEARPVYLVHEVDRFQVVRAIDLTPAELREAPQALRHLPVWGPRTIGTADPAAGDEQLNLVASALAGRDKAFLPSYWRPYESARAQVLARAKPLETLKRRYADRADEFDALVSRAGLPMADLRYAPLVARRADWIVLIDARTADIVGYAPFDGF
jgi:hypothetical protein